MEALIILLTIVIPLAVAWLLDVKYIPRRKSKKAIEKPLEVIPLPKFHDIEDVVQKLPDVKEHARKLMNRHRECWEAKRLWQHDFDRIHKENSHKLCTGHVFDQEGNRWWACTKCGYEKSWYYTVDCDCQYEMVSTLSQMGWNYVLTKRQAVCRVHGRDYKAYAEQRMDYHKEQFAKGGVILNNEKENI